MVQYFIDGGGFMWPILISLIFGLGFSFERAYSLVISSINSKKFYEDPKGSIIPLGGIAGHKGFALSS